MSVLADRLHNMMTLQYKKNLEKQQMKAMETLSIYVPIAEALGLYKVKCDLEDKCFMFLKPNEYEKYTDIRNRYQESTRNLVAEVTSRINEVLLANDIPNTIKFRLQNVYGIFKSLMLRESLEDIHDFLAFKIILDDIDACYLSLRHVHETFKPLTQYFKDYISLPKQNHYQALHTTVIGPESKIFQMQLKTASMEKVALYGITDFWHGDEDVGAKEMQASLKENYHFYKAVLEINKLASSNQEFVELMKDEVFAEKIHVFTKDGVLIDDLAKGATALDFAYRIHSDIGDSMVAALVNGKSVNYDYKHKYLFYMFVALMYINDKNHLM